MNLPLFISQKISRPGSNTFSSMIHKIAILSIAVGLGVMILSFIIMRGFQETITHKLVGFGGHIQITKYTLNSTYEELPIAKDDSIYEALHKVSFIDHIQGVAHKVGLIQTEEEIHGVVFKGVDENFNQERFGQSLVEGEFIHLNDTGVSYEVMISQKIAGLLNLHVGEDIRIYFIQNPPRIRRLNITGIYSSGMEEFDEKTIIGDISVIQQLNDWRSSLVGTVEIFIDDFNQLDEAENYLFDMVDYDLFVDKITDKHIEIFDWLSLVGRNVTILLILILFVASFNMISVLLILIMERTQMIGILKAVGSSDRMIRKIFSYHGIRLILWGLLWGNLIGIGLGWIQSRFKLIPLDPENYYMNYVPIKWEWMGIIGINLLVLVIISLVLIIPTLIISRIEPIRSIRFD
ncbi:MAG: ABC transporter permease [Cyclobacteriaceae bacterium]|nr:ABC transporter permease [Cyclobacteriaceae bacterium]